MARDFFDDDNRTEELRLVHEASVGCLIYVHGHGPNPPQSLRLPSGSVSLGSARDCDLTLADSSVSRQHLRLTIRDDGVLAEDLGSTNGTVYLGQRVERLVLTGGARLGLGRVQVDVVPLALVERAVLSPRDSYGDLRGSSAPMRRIYALLEMLESSEAPVLIEGETGTGKELVARALHDHSRRADQPFIIIDCANIPAELIESELFGHRKGAFTGAIADRQGAFEAADGGTIFLDEIGELTTDLQPRLLRALETGQVRRVGDTDHIKIDVRVLAATHRDVGAMVAEGLFRDDLFYRLAVIRLTLPPLRERREDIAELARHLATGIGEGTAELPTAAIDFFQRYDWPGNVRELRNAVHRLLALGIVETGDLEVHGAVSPGGPRAAPEQMQEVDSRVKYHRARKDVVDAFERAYLIDLVARHENNLSAASRAAGIDRKYLRELLKKHDLYDK